MNSKVAVLEAEIAELQAAKDEMQAAFYREVQELRNQADTYRAMWVQADNNKVFLHAANEKIVSL